MPWLSQDGHCEFRQPTRYRLLRPSGGATPRSLLVGLHGMGQDAEKLEDDLSPLGNSPRVVLLPNGPLPFETTNPQGGRRRGHAWYIYTGDQATFIESAMRTGEWLLELIASLQQDPRLRDLPVILLGYSQGGYLGGILAMRHPNAFRALCVINSRLKDEIASETLAPAIPPTLVLHGERDRFIPVDRAEASARALMDRGLPVEFQRFPSGHSLREDQVVAVDAWLNAMKL